MDKYAITIDENNKIEAEIERLLCNTENEWEYVISQTEHLTESYVFDDAKDMCYFVIKDGTLFYCGPVNVSRTDLGGESAWRYDYVYFSRGKRKIHRDLSHIWSSAYKVFKDVEKSDEIICVPTVLSCIDGEVQYIKKCKVYEANQIGDTYIVDWYREKKDAKRYEISIYKNSVLRKKIASALYAKMSPTIGTILYSNVSFFKLILDGGSIFTYDYINEIEKEEVKKGRIQEKQELYGYHNYIKVDRQIYRYLPEGFYYTDEQRQRFDKDFNVFKQLLPKFGIIKELEVKDYYRHGEYCFIADINNCLRWLLEMMENNGIYKQNETYTFRIEENFDKIYYCVSALSVEAKKIEKNGDVYELTFAGDNLETIELMYYFATVGGQWDARNREEKKIIDYLIRYSNIWLTVFVIESLIEQLNRQSDTYHCPQCYSSILYEIIKKAKKHIKKKADELYRHMIDEGRVPVKWGHELKLYMTIRKYVKNVEYQYRCEWLGLQSFDIFLPDYNVAIEYQGQQHYEPVDFFGGEESFEKNAERDEKKRRLAEENGVVVLDWGYWEKISEESVKAFLCGNKINIEERDDNQDRVNNIMAPMILSVEKRKNLVKRQENVKEWYVQYSIEGKFISKYESAKSASEAVGVSSTSILKCIKKERNTAGGFVWKKMPAEQEIQGTIEVDFDTTKTNTGKAIKVIKMDEDGNIINEYSSLQEAAMDSKIKVETIKRKAKKREDGWKLVL